MCARKNEREEYWKFIQFIVLFVVNKESSALMTFFACYSLVVATLQPIYTVIPMLSVPFTLSLSFSLMQKNTIIEKLLHSITFSLFVCACRCRHVQLWTFEFDFDIFHSFVRRSDFNWIELVWCKPFVCRKITNKKKTLFEWMKWNAEKKNWIKFISHVIRTYFHLI